MTTTTKSAIAGTTTVLGVGTAVTAYQLTKDNSNDSTEKIEASKNNENKNINNKPKQELDKQPKKVTVEGKQEEKPNNIFDIKHKFTRRESSIKPIEFKALEGKGKPKWIDTTNHPQGICATDNNESECEWSDLLRARVPKEKREQLERSAQDHATKKCSSIKGTMKDDTNSNPKGWITCTYSENLYVKSASLYDLNLDNEALYSE
ncbi:hypothetical protein [Candidatus Mycoplasma haematohominis]|uniref:Uncharacterized protein n=1 Tax=Candidatus Mycoplasma haematohominis TaxID=1494318 RepID=A0A478FSQ7_9MOLU|nr:hypothetical protein [Candidatus Mycoplasma haemohominis]GCE63040.1 hypothetical protein MHSWG343_00180 [Candidatus Mycoplasma haemohominis]